MDKATQDLFENINSNLKNLSSFFDKLSKQEIKIDSSRIYIIDYSQYLWLNLPKHNGIKKQLEEYNQQSINALINDDFPEFCRKVYMQIEILLNQFTLKQSGAVKTQEPDYYKKSKLYDFFKIINNNPDDFNPYDYPEYKIIAFIMDIRDFASHGDTSGKSLSDRVEAKGKTIRIEFKKLKNNTIENNIQKLFTQYVANENPNFVKIKIDNQTGWASIQLTNLKDNFLTSDKIVSDIKPTLKALRHQFGNNVEVVKAKKQFPNELKDFFDQKNYQTINQTMNWFVKIVGDFLN
ncbi:hypothetical protein H6G80_16370 [Nostoc sp. FACHB-87]|uniref:hypothetical protein n=1 Tax=Nostocaceae TaxID=1162 RepID=UPI0016861247|nr:MULTISPECIES: hypothetical protein [Nostocaceae]MBD2455650.1 hypothetical protein [Nostoc sp. FACHB-87]MBD2477281.1 hypothetical protein [Anabaena sp. FACHB-83]